MTTGFLNGSSRFPITSASIIWFLHFNISVVFLNSSYVSTHTHACTHVHTHTLRMLLREQFDFSNTVISQHKLAAPKYEYVEPVLLAGVP
ncbi:mCG146969 [Mus musculus]|nr:mCG146969 [Mus musculus]